MGAKSQATLISTTNINHARRFSRRERRKARMTHGTAKKTTAKQYYRKTNTNSKSWTPLCSSQRQNRAITPLVVKRPPTLIEPTFLRISSQIIWSRSWTTWPFPWTYAQSQGISITMSISSARKMVTLQNVASGEGYYNMWKDCTSPTRKRTEARIIQYIFHRTPYLYQRWQYLHL